MTDTTDIKALREAYKGVEKHAHSMRGNPREYQVMTGLCPVNVIEMQAQRIVDLLDQLEAERQRAAIIEQTSQMRLERVEKAEARVKELEGDQVPVALVDERRGSGGFCLTQHGRGLNLQHGTELFTAPQKKGGEDADD